MPIDAQAVLKKALIQLEAQKAETEKEIRALKSALAALGVSSPNLAGRRPRKPMTAAERRSVSKRMKSYWAKRRSRKAR
ncbi:MAG: hypothetical protein A3J29_19100 [Acidobacteria bacterium RIFCSPLOWO2_12_FULL_67_14b]|nr:MAG: hypothetical protein A3J29_19100 [Acidobacteria bacterium RIFCSPLOWO2_12_FULL_67_14b]